MLDEIAEHPSFPTIYWLMVWVHSWSFVCIGINVWLSKIRFDTADYPYMVLLGVVYSGVNYVASIARGKPLYHFLDWNQPITYLIAIGLLLLGVGIFVGICKVVNKLKGYHPLSSKTE